MIILVIQQQPYNEDFTVSEQRFVLLDSTYLLTTDHRLHGNRIMREFLLGQKNIQHLDGTIKTQEFVYVKNVPLISKSRNQTENVSILEI